MDAEDSDLVEFDHAAWNGRLDATTEHWLAENPGLPLDVDELTRESCVERNSSESRARRISGRWAPALRRHRVKIAIAMCLLVIGIPCWAAWEHLHGPLFEDSLTSGWFDSTKWLRPPEKLKAGGVVAEKGHMRLVNRGYLTTKREFTEPVDIRFEWKWNKLGLLNPLYADHLGVAIRTNAKPNMLEAGEAADGLIVKFNAWDGSVYAHDGDNKVSFGTTASGAFPMPADEWHQIRITDDGEEISVFITGPLIKSAEEEKPVLTFRKPAKDGGKRIAIYNRELLEFPHESCIRNFVVYRLSKK